MLELRIEKNKIQNTPQNIIIPNKVITLIGENGCGKSAILEALFEQYKDNENFRVICFASGQNESFTNIYRKYLKQSKKYLIETYAENPVGNYINSFFFNPDWSRILILFATTLRVEGLTYKCLKDNGYLIQEVDTESAFPFLFTSFRIYRKYIRKIQIALESEKNIPDFKSIRKTNFHEILTNLAEAKYLPNYEFEYSIYKNRIQILSGDVIKIFGKNVDEIFTFFGLSCKDNDFIVLDESLLFFENGRELNDLSDGEFQLLTIYSLIDLFDGDNTLFLFDEIDSHLYFENVNKLWEKLKAIKGAIITTTHSGDSIIRNDINDIKLVDAGLVNENTLANMVLTRLDNLAGGNYYKMKVAAKVKYIALVENRIDWFIFEHLCRIKITNFDEQKFTQIQYIPCSSGFASIRQDFGKDKMNWVNEFKKLNGDDIETKKIFMICDRDDLPIRDIRSDGVTVNAPIATIQFPDNGTAYLLSWKRKEIENYLVSYTMLNRNSKLQQILNLLPANTLVENQSCDNNSVRDLVVKDCLQPLYLHDIPEQGVDFQKLELIVKDIPPQEISDDIVNMYNFIISKIN